MEKGKRRTERSEYPMYNVRGSVVVIRVKGRAVVVP